MMIRVRLLSSQPQKLFRSLFKSIHDEGVFQRSYLTLDSGFSRIIGGVGGHDTLNLNNVVLANTSIRISASLSRDNYHETNPNSSQTMEESKLINKKKKEAAKKLEPEEALLSKFEAWSKKYRGTYSTKKDEPYWFKVFKANYESVNSKKMLPPEKLEREVAYLNKFKAWSKKYRRTYSTKKDEGFWLMVFKANYGSQNNKTILPPKKLVMPIDGHHFAGLLPKDFDQNSPLAKLHKHGQWEYI